MTYAAFNASQLSKPELQSQLGITNMLAVSPTSPFKSATATPNAYAAINAETMATFIKVDDFYEIKDFLDVPFISRDHSLVGWLMRGAIREDDNPVETPHSDEEGGVFARVYNHFFDPIKDRGLTVKVTLGRTSVDWALKKGVTTNALAPNLYSNSSAVEAMYRALTLRDANGFEGMPLHGATKEEVRKMYWATLFRDLGNTIHLLQDTGQPQHTRNDAHSGFGCIAYKEYCAAGHDSFYEKYIRARTMGSTAFSLAEGLDSAHTLPPNEIKFNPIDYGNYGVIQTSSLSAFFHSGENETGNGLANYSSRGFYTFGRNANDSTYPLPNRLSLERVEMLAPSNMVGAPLGGRLTFLRGPVVDTVQPGLTESALLTTVGGWNQFLTDPNYALPNAFSLNYYNYDDQARLLIPRTVGYSAGIINHFFRGRLEITLPKEKVYAIGDTADPGVNGVSMGFSKMKLNVRNISQGIGGIAQVQATGTLRAVVKFHRNKCYAPDFSGEYGSPGQSVATCRDPHEEISVSSLVSAPVGMNSSAQEVTFVFPNHIPIGSSDLYLQVVYRGPLGEDSEAIAVGTKDIGEPAFFTAATTAEQRLYGGMAETFRKHFCENAKPPIPYEECRIKHRVSFYLRFAEPENFDPNNPIPTFDALASFNGMKVSQYGRIAYLADLGMRRVFILAVEPENFSPPYAFQTVEGEVTPYQYDMSGTETQVPLLWKRERGAFVSGLILDDILAGQVYPAPDYAPIDPHPAVIKSEPTPLGKQQQLETTASSASAPIGTREQRGGGADARVASGYKAKPSRAPEMASDRNPRVIYQGLEGITVTPSVQRQ